MWLIRDILYRRGHLEKVGGSLYLAELLESAVTTANTAHHARLIREKSLYRGLINLSTEITAGAMEQAELQGILAQAHQSLLQMGVGKDSCKISPDDF
jgi:replicative DNA helicase